jgi:probable HAF family extracellular repeat protein
MAKVFFGPMQRAVFGLAWLGLFMASADVRAAGYTLTLLQPPTPMGAAPQSAIATAINNAGQVTGYTNDVVTGTTHHRAVVWNDTEPTVLDSLGGVDSVALAINSVGQVAGWSSTASGDTTAALWNGTQPTALAPLKSSAFAYGINDAGQVVGQCLSLPTMWSNGNAVTLGDGQHNGVAYAINNAGQVGGRMTYGRNPTQEATVWNGTTPTNLFASGLRAISSVYAINNAGVMAGVVPVLTIYTYRAALWTGGRQVLLQGLPNSSYVLATGINNLGQVVGQSNGPSDGLDRAVTWHGILVTDLNKYLDADTVSAGWILTSAAGINDSGWIVGSAYNTVTKTGRGFVLKPK